MEQSVGGGDGGSGASPTASTQLAEHIASRVAELITVSLNSQLCKQEEFLRQIQAAVAAGPQTLNASNGISVPPVSPGGISAFPTMSPRRRDVSSHDISEAIVALNEMAGGQIWPPEKLMGSPEPSPSIHSVTPKESCITQTTQEDVFPENNKLLLQAKAITSAVLSLQEPERVGVLASIVLSKSFRVFVALLVALNCIFIMYQTDRSMKSYYIDVGSDRVISVLESIFVFVFSVELFMKLAVHRLYFFCNDDFRFNWLDLVLVGPACVLLLHDLTSDTDSANPSFMRALRILKVARLGRVLKVLDFEVVRQIRVSLAALGSSCMAVSWTMALLFFLLIAIGLFFMQAMVQACESRQLSEGLDFFESQRYHNIIANFGSLGTSVITLFQATTGGTDWKETFDVLADANPMYAFPFVCFIFFFQFAVFNVLTGLIVNTVNRSSERDDEAIMLEEEVDYRERQKEAQKLFHSLDSDGSGLLTVNEFKGGINNPHVVAAFHSIQVDPIDAESLFRTLCDIHGEDCVPVSAFTEGCQRMRGVASRVDVHLLSTQVKAMQNTQKEIARQQHHDGRFVAVALSAVLGGLPIAAAEPAGRPGTTCSKTPLSGGKEEFPINHKSLRCLLWDGDTVI